MKYMEYSLILGIGIITLYTIWYGYHRLKLYHFYKLSWKALIKQQNKLNGKKYRPSYYVFVINKKLLTGTGKTARKTLLALMAGRMKSVSNYWHKKGEYTLKLIAEAMQNQLSALDKMNLQIKKNPQNYQLLCEMAYLYWLKNDISKCKLCLDNIKPNKLSNYVKAKFLFLQSYLDVNDGDMLSASQKCSQALKLFHKLKAYYEEAMTYLQMGVIYRTSIITDVAQIMFETAIKLFNESGCREEEAETLGNLGMLMAIQKRFEEADDYYKKAEKICLEHKLKQKHAEIINQCGILNILREKYEPAKDCAEKALKIHRQNEDEVGMALSKDILANCAWNRKDYKKTLQIAEEAEKLYLKNYNYSAVLEMMYLTALTYFEQSDLTNAETKLREIIKISKQNSSNFHVANAYNLLGLIYLQKNDLRRAKGLFQQSLDLEQVNNRFSGVATDYVNIGAIELTRGNKEEAKKTLDTAMEYAKASEDEELILILQQRIAQMLKS